MAKRMGEGRMLRKSFFTSADLTDLPYWASVLWAGMFTFADDDGVIRNNMALYRGTILARQNGVRVPKPFAIREALRAFWDRGMIEPCGHYEDASGLGAGTRGNVQGSERAVEGTDRALEGTDRAVEGTDGERLGHLRERIGHEREKIVAVSHWRIKNFLSHQRIPGEKDGGIEEKGKERKGKGKEEEGKGTAGDLPLSECDWGIHLSAWNALAEKHGRPVVRTLTQGRKTELAARLADCPDLWARLDEALGNLSEWARSQAFLNFDWLMDQENLAKVLEGNYSKELDRSKEQKAKDAEEAEERKRNREIAEAMQARKAEEASRRKKSRPEEMSLIIEKFREKHA